MKPSSLHALVIDRHFGELSPEAVELLELHLSHDAAARAEAERVLQSLATTQAAVLRHPELAHVPPAPAKTVPAAVSKPRWQPVLRSWLARAAVVALACTTGFMLGRSESRTTGHNSTLHVASTTPEQPRKDSPWARYRMNFDPTGEGMQVVRVDTAGLEQKSIP